MKESKTIKNLKKKLIKELPSFPNNKDTKEILESKNLTDLLIAYLSWKVRLIPIRKRSIIINDKVDLTNEKIASIINSENYINLKNKIESGDDINPYLSLTSHDKGYSPQAEDGDNWIDKDFILNVMDFYHFHLLAYEKDKQESTRTNELIFAKVDRTTFEIVGIFDHTVFESSEDNHDLNLERKRLFEIFDSYNIEIPTGITLSSHTTTIVDISIKYSKIINKYDEKLKDKSFLDILYKNKSMPKKPNLSWCINGTDLGIIDKDNIFFILSHGKNL